MNDSTAVIVAVVILAAGVAALFIFKPAPPTDPIGDLLGKGIATGEKVIGGIVTPISNTIGSIF